jgi:hypothetical protein
MKTRAIAVPLAAMTITTLGLGTSSASAASMSCSQAKAAVKRELKRSEFDNSRVSEVRRLSCRRLSSTRAKVYWKADTQNDIATGNVGGHAGYASVRKYSYGIDVSLVVTDD